MELTGQIFTFFVLVIIAVALYYLYKWLQGSDDLQNVVIFSPKRQGMPANSTNPVVYNELTLPPLYPGGEFSVSTWIYVNNWNERSGRNKLFFRLSGGSAEASNVETLVMYLGQNVNKLSVRVSSASSVTSAGSGSAIDSVQLNSETITKITQDSPTSVFTDDSTGFKKCDIEEIDLQRWVNITVCLSGKTVDVYMDGKLSRSCVLNSMYHVTGDRTKVELAGPSGFGGYIGQTQIANYAYSPDQVYKMYQNGPMDQSLWAMISGMFTASASFTLPDSAKNLITVTPANNY
jgi:hypothetical protein